MRAALPLLLLLAACADGREPARDGRLDGLWRATAIDGQPVGRTEFLIRVRGGRVVGGKDGCNSWAFEMTRPPEPNGHRTIVTDLMDCGPVPLEAAYWRALGNGNVVPRADETGELRLRAAGSEIVARRTERPA
jgi:hypothetical protein